MSNKLNRRPACRLTIAAFLTMACSHAIAQWTFTTLRPPSPPLYDYSTAWDVNETSEFGGAIQSGVSFPAAKWSGTPASFEIVAESGMILGSHGNRMVGIRGVTTRDATLWIDGVPIDLTPGSATGYAWDVHGDTQVGSVNGLAALWHDTAESLVSLHPAALGSESEALATFGDRQAGYAKAGFGPEKAIMWMGSAASATPMGPLGSSRSIIREMDENQQVGVVDDEAGFWTGTPESWTSLQPFPYVRSEAFGVAEAQQVGRAFNEFQFSKPILWHSSDTNYSILPHPGWHEGIALAVFDNGDVTRVVGSVSIDKGALVSAALWVRENTLIAPESINVVRGVIVGGGLPQLLASDDDRFILRPGVTFSTAQDPIELTVEATSPRTTTPLLGFQVEWNCSSPAIRLTMELYNYATGVYDTVETHPSQTADMVQRVNATINADDHIEPGTQAIKARIAFKATGPVFAYPWTASIDRVRWILPGT